ncbi:MAG: hypothetical protein JRI57_11045 [Deltaproteobacteria bacterium]|nr:hypothetical protein [Deltaproteobacteria bacterium]MBW1987789.1 hypothetical protein [Deltaproteobacteria bacterium]
MSGYKYSQIALQRERQQKLDLLEQLAETEQEAQGLQQEMTRMLAELSPGLRASFAAPIAQAEKWQQQWSAGPKLTINASLGEIEGALQTARQQLAAGQSRVKELVQVITHTAPAREQALQCQSAELAARLQGAGELLQTWFPDLLQEAAGRRRQVQDALEAQEYEAAARQLYQWEAEIAERLAQSHELQAQQERRLYVLTGLRQICVELGFAETGVPHYERPGDLRSAIIYTVDTFDEGDIRFSLGLDGIQTHSEIREDYCLAEFDKLSAALEEQYGIRTQFQRVGEAAPERLRQKGEKDLPDEGTTRVSEA